MVSLAHKIRKIYENQFVYSKYRTIEDVFPLLQPETARFVVEIGACNGNDTLRLAKTFPNARILSFEPDPRNLQAIAALDLPDRVQVLPCAVGARPGKATFFQSRPNPEYYGDEANGRANEPSGSGSLRQPTGHLERWPALIFDHTIEVEVVTLQDALADAGFDHVHFIWADTQGAEMDVIEGAGAAMATVRYFYTEYSNNEYFAGQSNLQQIKAALPTHRVRELFRDDALFERLS